MHILNLLGEIVGSDYVSNRAEELYLYSRDSGAQHPGRAQYVVMPCTTIEVQQIVNLANEFKIPLVPMGGGFTLSALTVPHNGGIVVDMKRMDRIIEVNDKDRYAVIEAGVTQGALRRYLARNYPHLQHSTPEAPPTVTVAGNCLIRGHGHISPRYGINSELVNCLEVVLPNGDICTLGSASMSDYWFTRGPLPDLAGLFIGWLGTTGIVTRMSVQLFPKPAFKDLLAFRTDNPDIIPDFIFDITQLDLYEDFFLIAQEIPAYMNHVYMMVIFSGHSEDDFDLKRRENLRIAQTYIQKGEVEIADDIPPALRQRFLDVPPFAAAAADFRKGGGFEYTGAIIPSTQIPAAWRKGIEIARKHNMLYSYAHQILTGHSIMFGFNYSFNRADEADAERVRKAIDESNKFTLELGGMVWKPERAAQQMMIKKMDPNTVKLMKTIRKSIDPNGIMNPGVWEA